MAFDLVEKGLMKEEILHQIMDHKFIPKGSTKETTIGEHFEKQITNGLGMTFDDRIGDMHIKKTEQVDKENKRKDAEFRTEFEKMSAEQISFPRSCNNVAKYKHANDVFIKGTPIHVKGALIYNHQLKEFKLSRKYPLIQEGDKIKFLKLVEPNPFKFDVISYITKLPNEFKLQEYIDHDTMFQKTFLDPLSFILNSIGWSYEKKASLEAFFE